MIVPVYKVEPYLRRCVDSILSQTFTDFDLVLIDDGSPDQCGVICDNYTKSVCGSDPDFSTSNSARYRQPCKRGPCTYGRGPFYKVRFLDSAISAYSFAKYLS